MGLRSYLKQGLKVGLGTDVAGGYSPSMLDAMRQVLLLTRDEDDDDGLNYCLLCTGLHDSAIHIALTWHIYIL